MVSTTASTWPDDLFGADLYRVLGGTGNLVFAPASIAAALQMTLLGARGETATQLAATLHLDVPVPAGRHARRPVLPGARRGPAGA